MPLRFDDNGVHFRYPDNWQLERDQGESGWTVSVQSPKTAFFLIAVDEEMPTPEAVAETALAALEADYPELEAEDRFDTVAGHPALGHDIQFISLDLTNTCWTRSFYGAGGTVLVMWQANDLDLDAYESVLRAMAASLQVDED